MVTFENFNKILINNYEENFYFLALRSNDDHSICAVESYYDAG